MVNFFLANADFSQENPVKLGKRGLGKASEDYRQMTHGWADPENSVKTR